MAPAPLRAWPERDGPLEQLYASDLMDTRDAVEGLTAFLETRPVRREDR